MSGKHLLAAALVMTMAGASNAALINISVGESATANGGPAGGDQTASNADLAPGQSGLLTEVIGGQTWNNLAVATGAPVGQSLVDSLGNATGLSATSVGAGEFVESRDDPNLGGDLGQTVLSAFGTNGTGGIPTLTISGFAANQQLGDLTFWSLGDAATNQAATMNVTINGGAPVAVGVFVEGADVFANVSANANGQLIITSSNHIAAISLEYDAIPEPASIALLASGGLLMLRRRR